MLLLYTTLVNRSVRFQSRAMLVWYRLKHTASDQASLRNSKGRTSEEHSSGPTPFQVAHNMATRLDPSETGHSNVEFFDCSISPDSFVAISCYIESSTKVLCGWEVPFDFIIEYTVQYRYNP